MAADRVPIREKRHQQVGERREAHASQIQDDECRDDADDGMFSAHQVARSYGSIAPQMKIAT